MTDLALPLDPAQFDAGQFDATIAYLRELSRAALLQYAVTVGKYLVDEYFAGDVTTYFDRSRYKASSFAALLETRAADLTELGLSGSTLRNYIGAWDVWRQLPEAVHTKLDLVDLYQLAAVKEPAARTELATAAVTQNWGVRRLHTAVQTWQEGQRSGEKRGPKPMPELVKHLSDLARLAGKVAGTLHHAGPLQGKDRERALTDLARLETHVAAARAALGTVG
jgi:hypothetical protein